MYDKDMPRDEKITLFEIVSYIITVSSIMALVMLEFKAGLVAEKWYGPIIVFGTILLGIAIHVYVVGRREE